MIRNLNPYGLQAIVFIVFLMDNNLWHINCIYA